MARRILAGLGFAFGLVMFLVVGGIAWGYIRRPNQVANTEDWFMVLLPSVACALAITVSIAMLFPRGRNAAVRGAVHGLFVAMQLLLAILASYLLSQGDVIANDGTAFWGLLFLPTVLIGFPMAVAGIAIGAVVTLVVDNRRGKNRAFEQRSKE